MRDFAEFEIHSNSELVGDLWESFLVLVHRPCGKMLGEQEGYDMINLATAAELAMGHECNA